VIKFLSGRPRLKEFKDDLLLESHTKKSQPFGLLA